MIDPLCLIDLDARVAAWDAIDASARIFDLERRLTRVEREAIIAQNLAAARRELSCYARKDADAAFKRAVNAIMEEIASSSIERVAAEGRPEYAALSPEEGAAILLERRA